MRGSTSIYKVGDMDRVCINVLLQRGVCIEITLNLKCIKCKPMVIQNTLFLYIALLKIFKGTPDKFP